MRMVHGWIRRRRGQAIVETGLFSIVLLYLIVGAADFGRMMFASVTVTQAAKDGARKGAAYPHCRLSVADYASVATASQNTTYNSIDFAVAQSGQLLGLGSDHITVSHYRYDAATGTRAASLSALTGGQIDVTVSYPFTTITPFVGSVVGSVNVTATATHVVEAAPAGC